MPKLHSYHFTIHGDGIALAESTEILKERLKNLIRGQKFTETNFEINVEPGKEVLKPIPALEDEPKPSALKRSIQPRFNPPKHLIQPLPSKTVTKPKLSLTLLMPNKPK